MRNSTIAEQALSFHFAKQDKKTQDFLKFELVPYMIESIEKETDWFIWSVYGSNQLSFYNPITFIDAYAYYQILSIQSRKQFFLSVSFITNNAFPDKDIKNNKKTLLDSFYIEEEDLYIESGKHGADAFFELKDNRGFILSALPPGDKDQKILDDFMTKQKILKAPECISVEIGTYNMIRLWSDLVMDSCNILRIPYAPHSDELKNKAFLYSVDDTARSVYLLDELEKSEGNHRKNVYQELMKQKEFFDGLDAIGNSYKEKKVNPDQLSLF